MNLAINSENKGLCLRILEGIVNKLDKFTTIAQSLSVNALCSQSDSKGLQWAGQDSNLGPTLRQSVVLTKLDRRLRLFLG